MDALKIRIMPVNVVVLAIGLLDLVTTLFWLATGQVIEVNPVMAAVLQAGVAVFILVKVVTLGAYVAVMEWYRRNRSYVFAQTVGNITVLAYVGIYAVSFYSVNHAYFWG
jgi:hypothetical protein